MVIKAAFAFARDRPAVPRKIKQVHELPVLERYNERNLRYNKVLIYRVPYKFCISTL